MKTARSRVISFDEGEENVERIFFARENCEAQQKETIVVEGIGGKIHSQKINVHET